MELFDLLLDAFIKIIKAGITTTIPVTIVSFSLGLLIAIITALVQIANIKVLKQIARFYIWIIRGTPLLVQLFVVFYGLPNLGILIEPIPAAIIVFSINEGAYSAETIRAAIQAVPTGQIEAGHSIALNYFQILFHIVLPQAMRTAFAPLCNSLIGMIKDTSLLSSITVAEMFYRTKQIAGNSFKFFALYVEVGLVYLLICTFLSQAQRTIEKRMRKLD